MPRPLIIAPLTLETAARVWAAACHVAGAYAPAHIAAVLVRAHGDWPLAAAHGTSAAQAEHDAAGAGGPPPRGVAVDVAAGAACGLVWITASGTVEIGRCAPDATDAAGRHYLVRITSTSPLRRASAVRELAAWFESAEVAALDSAQDQARADGLVDDASTLATRGVERSNLLTALLAEVR